LTIIPGRSSYSRTRAFDISRIFSSSRESPTSIDRPCAIKGYRQLGNNST
jgi:hypothetical protein